MGTSTVQHQGILWTRKAQAGGAPGGERRKTCGPPPGFSEGSGGFSEALGSGGFSEGSGGFSETEEAGHTERATQTKSDNFITYFPVQTDSISIIELNYLRQISAESLGEKLSNLSSQLVKLKL